MSIVFGLAFLRTTDVTFDKIGQTCSVRRFDVLRWLRMDLKFAEITDIKVETAPLEGDLESISCRLSLVTSSDVVPLTMSYEPDFDRHNRMRDVMLEVLFGDSGRPVADDPILALIKQGRIIDAVAVLRKRDGLDLSSASKRVNEIRNAAKICPTLADPR